MNKNINQLRALIVDDEESIGLMTKNLLLRRGIAAEEANSFMQASRRINKNRYDLYFLDLNLPDGSGFELLQQIKEQQHGSQVIILSAHDGAEEQAKANELGADAFIGKPFTGNDIQRIVDKFAIK